MDYEMFETIIHAFNKDNEYCKYNKTEVTDVQAKALFLLLDVDGSGELEQEEVMEVLIDKQLLGQNKEEKVKSDAKEFVQKAFQKAKRFVSDLTGFNWSNLIPLSLIKQKLTGPVSNLVLLVHHEILLRHEILARQRFYLQNAFRLSKYGLIIDSTWFQTGVKLLNVEFGRACSLQVFFNYFR